MKKGLLLLCLFTALHSLAQPDTSKLVRAFPITDYMVDLPIVGDDTNNIDSIKIVQLKLPDGVTIAEKQLGDVYKRQIQDGRTRTFYQIRP